jgi:FdhD protein
MGYYDSVRLVHYFSQQAGKGIMSKGREMINTTERLPVLRVTEKSRDNTVDVVVAEFPLTITLNNREVVTLLCSPVNLEYLTVGFLFSEGLIKSKDDIREIIVDEERGTVQVKTKKGSGLVSPSLSKRLVASGGGRGALIYPPYARTKVKSSIEILASEIFTLVDDFVQRSAVFKATGGVHSAALCDTESILVFSEDIGRHNAIDKVFGECMLEDISTAGCLVITSGRVSSEILLKVAKRNIPLLISKSAPTTMGVKLAGDLGITLVGFARGRKANIYANEGRVVTG